MKVILLIISLCLFQKCNLFIKEMKLLSEFKKKNGEKIQIYFVGLGATTDDVIQVYKSSNTNPIYVTKHNYLKYSRLINDTSLFLVLGDTSYFNDKNSFDTIFVNVR